MNERSESATGAADLPAVHRWARVAALVGLLLVPVVCLQALAVGLDKYTSRPAPGPDVYGAALLSAALGVYALVTRSRTTEPLFRAFLVGCQLFVLLYAFSGAAG
ncbi:hypothetical protein [Streptomyces bohaiensis]|uniref:Sensor histidine kinase n=1 Tax=Streptomyces bohaiensis TaxID=1431344 RepID=A0ABX1C783_9ACTN|nr:hypothetical protein [Streptomyces bohaiensis]NJQ14858.1 hypothetical protein [Streptomyces bohaiensis]